MPTATDSNEHTDPAVPICDAGTLQPQSVDSRHRPCCHDLCGASKAAKTTPENPHNCERNGVRWRRCGAVFPDTRVFLEVQRVAAAVDERGCEIIIPGGERAGRRRFHAAAFRAGSTSLRRAWASRASCRQGAGIGFVLVGGAEKGASRRETEKSSRDAVIFFGVSKQAFGLRFEGSTKADAGVTKVMTPAQ